MIAWLRKEISNYHGDNFMYDLMVETPKFPNDLPLLCALVARSSLSSSPPPWRVRCIYLGSSNHGRLPRRHTCECAAYTSESISRSNFTPRRNHGRLPRRDVTTHSLQQRALEDRIEFRQIHPGEIWVVRTCEQDQHAPRLREQ